MAHRSQPLAAPTVVTVATQVSDSLAAHPAHEEADRSPTSPMRWRFRAVRVVCVGVLATAAALTITAAGSDMPDASDGPTVTLAVAAMRAPTTTATPVRTPGPTTPPTATPPPRPGPVSGPPVVPGVPDSAGTSPGCGLTDLGACVGETITGFFRGIVTMALNPLIGLLSDTLLTTPTPDSLPALARLWDGSWQILLTSYGLLVTIAGIVVMAHETLHSRYSIKEIAPRIVVGFFSGAVSLPVSGQAIGLANAVAHAILGDQLDPKTAGNTLRDLILAAVNENVLFVFLALILIGMTIGLLVGYVIRVGLTIILVAGAPIALMFHALPQTEGIAYGWWRAFGGCLAIQIAQSLALVTAFKVLLAPGGFTPFGTTRNGLVDMIVALALVWLLYRIPFWVLAAIRPGGGRRSLIGSLVRSYLAYRTFGLLTGRGRPATGAGRGPGGAGGGGGRGGPGPRPRPGPGGGGGRRAGGRTGPGAAAAGAGGGGDPYARVRATTGGQYVLPLPGVRPTPPPRPGPPTTTPPNAGPASTAGRRGRQLALPLDRDWPENRPRPGRDGQYQLPITVNRVPTPRRPAPASNVAPGRPRAGGTQLQLPFDPYRGIRPTTTGQYPLPLDVHRTRRPPAPPTTGPPTTGPPPSAATATPSTGTARSGAGRQLRLPLDLPRRSRRATPPPAAPTPPPRRSPS